VADQAATPGPPPPSRRLPYMAGWATPSHCLLPTRTPSQSEVGILPARAISQSEVGILPARVISQSEVGILHARSISQSDAGVTLCQYTGQAGQQLVHGRKSSPDEKEVGEVIQYKMYKIHLKN
jgi:hypothetical protein